MQNDTDPRSYLVVQANDFIRHPRTDKLTAREANIAYFLISKIKKSDKEFMTVNFTVKEFCRICGDNERSGENYRDVKSALKSLADKSAWIEVEKGRHRLVRWIDDCEIIDGEGMVTATLSQTIKPYLLNLTEHFTQAELRNYLALRSVYSKRLYELLRSHIHSKLENTKRYIFIEFELMELKKLLNAETYGRFKDFRVNVLERAKKEINIISDMDMDFSPIKTGRITTHVSFTIKLKNSIDRLSALMQADNVLDSNKP
ncbi:MAG: replication initiation protein [Oscillospiraceae bacterium]|nr:replication initiation protein [Oscillospiraceae bacterium]